MKFAIVIEQDQDGCSAYVPDLPGCVAAAATRSEVIELMREAIPMHLAGMRENGEALPTPTSVEFIDVAA